MARFVGSLYATWNEADFRRLADRWKVPLCRPTKSLSMGERRKLHLALAIAHNPHLLVLDEPLTYLDPQLSYELVDILREITDSRKIICWVSSNILEPFMGLADRIDFLSHGAIIDCREKAAFAGAPPRDLWDQIYG